MRVLLTSCPSYGHANPMLPLAREALHTGHEVVIATGAELVPEIERRGFDTWLVGPSRAESDATFRATNPNLETLSAEERMQVMMSSLFGPQLILPQGVRDIGSRLPEMGTRYRCSGPWVVVELSLSSHTHPILQGAPHEHV